MPRISVIFSFLRMLLGAALVAAVAAPVAAVAQVVVVANGSPITAYDIAQRSKLITITQHKTLSRQEVINELIDDRLKISKAKSYGLEVSNAEVDQAFANMAARQHVSAQQFAQLFERAGISPNTIKARLRADLTWSQLVRGKFSSSLQINESDINKALQARNDSQADAVGHVYTLYPIMVLIPAGSNASTIDSKRHIAESLRSRFSSCNSGLAMARALRDVAVREPVSRNSSELPAPLRELLDRLEIGHLTTPEVTPQGLQMFALCDKRQTKVDSPAKQQARQELFAQRFETESKKFLDEIRKQAMIEYK